MKFTLPIGNQNLYRMMRNQWKVARKRRVWDSGAEQILEKYKLDVVDANEFITPAKQQFDFSSIVGLAPKEILKDESHPLYKEQPCLVYGDSSVLLEGLHQALVFTNTVQLESENLPKKIEGLIDRVQLPNQDELVKRCIRTTCLYDAEQKKLPIRKDTERPAWNFPRDYGITDTRKNRMLCSRLVQLCGLASPDTSTHRGVLHNVPLSVPLEWDDEIVQLELRSDIFISSDKLCTPIVNANEADGHPLPELTVTHPLISLYEENIYELKNIFPLKEDCKFSQVHTIIIHYNETEVKNIFETPVSMEQMIGRSLMKAFATAVAQARYNYGLDVKILPKPVVVQCVQTDGKSFHFSVLQLNSADMTSSQRNIFWSLPPINLYEKCLYIGGVPMFEGYDPQVFKYLLAFYNNN